MKRLAERGSTIASDGVADFAGEHAPGTKAFLARDPDGHAVQVIRP
jgi:hypothetical protein